MKCLSFLPTPLNMFRTSASLNSPTSSERLYCSIDSSLAELQAHSRFYIDVCMNVMFVCMYASKQKQSKKKKDLDTDELIRNDCKNK